ncbi:MAG TPA: GDSL-type esterase/lipase family protein [Verrucomicrobiae bacterium]|jgi:acetyl esterase/lipase
MKFFSYLFVLAAVWLPVGLVATPNDPASQRPAIRLAVVGASIAAGFGTADHARDAYPSQLQRMLGPNWVVGNYGVSGTTLIHSGDAPYIKTPEYQRALAFKPDVLIIDLGGNDSKPFNYEAHSGDFIPDYQALIAAFRAVNPSLKIYAALPVPAFPQNYGIRDHVIVSNIIPATVQAAALANVSVIDLHTPLAGQGADFPDRVHPNETGAKLMAKVLYGVLQKDFPGQGSSPASAPQKNLHGFEGMDVWKDIEYAQINGHSLKLDLYIPENVSRPVPLIIDIHGGGWMALDKNEMVARSILQHGFAVASIDYRLTQEAIFPAQIYDCKAAVRWLRAHAAEYGLRSDKIGAWGDSAGGHLVSLLGLTANHPELEGEEGNLNVSSRVQAVCDFYGPSDLWTTNHLANDVADHAVPRLLGGLIEQNEAKARQASPLFYVTTNACPFLIVHGDQDPIVPLQQSINLNDALQKAGVASQLYVVKGGGHGFNSPEAFVAVVAFFNKYLKE